MICNISYADFSCNILYTCIKHIQILSKSYATCVRIISKYIVENTHFGGNLLGLFQTHNAIILLPIKRPSLYSKDLHILHLGRQKASRKLRRNFSIFGCTGCAETMACVCFYVQTYIYTLERKWPGYVDWILYLVSEGEKVSKIKTHSQVRDIFTRFLVPHFSSAFYEGTLESPGCPVAGFLGVFHIWKRWKFPNSWSLSISCIE